MDDGTDVKPSGHVENYLEPLTGLNKALIDQHGMPLEQVTPPPTDSTRFLLICNLTLSPTLDLLFQAMTILRQHLPKNAVLVGQNIKKDVEWLELQEGVDFGAMLDLSALFRVWNAKYSSFTYFGLDHASTCCLGQANDGAAHNAVTDAVKSMQV